jgi:hypothetical protein
MDETLKTQPEVIEEAQQSQSDKNFRLLRDNYEKAQQRLQELERERQDRLSAPQYQQPQYQQPRRDEDHDIDDEGYVSGKYYKELTKKVREQERKNQEISEHLARMQEQNIQASAEAKLKSQHSDYAQVVTSENMRTLAAISPDDVEAIANAKDWYAKGKLAYMALRHNGIAQTQASYAEQKLEENRNKPKSVASAPAKSAAGGALGFIENYDTRRIISDSDRERIQKKLQLMRDQANQ